MSLSLIKTPTLNLTRTHEIQLRLNGSGQLVWNDKDQKGNRNIFSGIVSGSVTASNLLFRVYDAGWIPGVSRLRHEILTQVGFDYAPSVNQADAQQLEDPEAIYLYPFGSSTYLFERKQLSLSLSTNLQVKTRYNQKYQAASLRLSTSRNYVQREALGNRKWEFLRADLQLTPLQEGQLRASFQASWDPNEYPPDSTIQRPPWSLITFASSLRYRSGDFRSGWSVDIGTQYQRLSRTASRSIVFGFEWRPNELFEVDVDTRFDYDRYREPELRGFRANPVMQALGLAYLYPYSQQITIRRNLRDWDLRIIWRRTGSIGSVRKEFTYQINLIADPSITVGLGLDAVTGRWGLRSLPIGVPPTFTGGNLGRSRF
ncbi:MAG: hypothetical protein KatS3mg115_0524 [Candidatus Poribacteria bacterium]|nr:MAG: hypothetical protein KatS3mg115_0524 [Candidatus Poribacteria bacterium]